MIPIYMVYTTRTNSLLTRCKQRAVRYSLRCTNRDPHFRLYLRESQRPSPHGRTPTAPWAIAHRPVGERPPPRGRWLFALQERKRRQNDSFPCFLFACSRCFSMRTHFILTPYKQGAILSRFPILCSMNCPQNCPKSPHFRQFHPARIYPMFVQM